MNYVETLSLQVRQQHSCLFQRNKPAVEKSRDIEIDTLTTCLRNSVITTEWTQHARDIPRQLHK